MAAVGARPGSTQEEVRRHNLSTLLREVHELGAVSRAQLTARMGLNRSTIKALVAELESAGLVREEIPDTRLGAGRPSHVVIPRREAAYTLAVNIGVDAVQVAVVRLGGSMATRKEYPMAGVGSDPERVVERLAKELRAMAGRASKGSRLVGVGIGLPGVVRSVDGWVEFAPNLRWHGVPFGDLLSDRLLLPAPVFVGNDGDVGALAELVRGAGRGVRNLVYVAGEVGVGGGLVIDGRLVRGAGGFAGEIGHLLVDPSGRPCRCGNVGCWETEVGEEALLRAAGMPTTGGRPAVRKVLERARAGEAEACLAVDHVASWLGRGIAALVNVLNPERVILGGQLAAVFAVAESSVRAAVRQHSLEGPRQGLRLMSAGLGAYSSLIGAGEVAFEPLLADPVEGPVVGTPAGPAVGHQS